jgi:hypothetical protein
LLLTGEVLRENLEHPVGWTDYATIAWIASSIGTVGGALGSGLERDAAVRAAAEEGVAASASASTWSSVAARSHRIALRGARFPGRPARTTRAGG